MSESDAESIAQLADLARIRLSDAEVEQFAGQLASIVELLDVLSRIDVTEVPETGTSIRWRARPDLPGDTLPLETVLGAAPVHHAGQFVVPKFKED